MYVRRNSVTASIQYSKCICMYTSCLARTRKWAWFTPEDLFLNVRGRGAEERLGEKESFLCVNYNCLFYFIILFLKSYHFIYLLNQMSW